MQGTWAPQASLSVAVLCSASRSTGLLPHTWCHYLKTWGGSSWGSLVPSAERGSALMFHVAGVKAPQIFSTSIFLLLFLWTHCLQAGQCLGLALLGESEPWPEGSRPSHPGCLPGPAQLGPSKAGGLGRAESRCCPLQGPLPSVSVGPGVSWGVALQPTRALPGEAQHVPWDRGGPITESLLEGLAAGPLCNPTQNPTRHRDSPSFPRNSLVCNSFCHDPTELFPLSRVATNLVRRLCERGRHLRGVLRHRYGPAPMQEGSSGTGCAPGPASFL